jgi:translation initiation factor 3 subunit B
MAPSFENLPVDEDYDEDEIDFSDLREQYEVRLEEGLDTFVIIDGLPKVPQESADKLKSFVLRKLKGVGKANGDTFFMPLGDDGVTEG